MATPMRQARSKPDSAAESRLQAALRELDKLDILDDDGSADIPESYDHSGPRERWSDNIADSD